MTTIGIIGAGHIGTALAQAATDAGYDVVLSNSRGPGTLTDLVEAIGARPSGRGSVRAATPAEAGAAGDLVVVTVPLSAVGDVPVEPLAGKVVIDTNNYYPERDGHIAALDDETTTTAELLQDHLPTSRVVKAFNHIYAADITARRTPPGTPERRALAIAGDDASAKETVASFIDELGFDVVDLGPLAEGWRTQRDTPGYGPDLDAGRLAEAAAAAKRYRDM
ncbi:MAG TPA: NAD(P)-binding domain-containing protein [Geodermatophilus sp.]|nr:NAD(P)-binding domain-containing protein [Geodermatophilus sp.]